ncbi:acyltransferase family protein [Ruania zhangjianzhongii]|uniref:acyltransferase family protein n=1 Tax=Ruania zhangjianzhongii TaxID=2603206 RepID=UPI0011C9565F|nr:acyltransferase [Ruania zhangjianzhongii]
MAITQRTATQSTRTSAHYRPALDGLRGVAIAGVLLFHTGHLPGGFLGVDLFFVLSGYLITGLLLRELRTRGTISLASFWGRRARRLLPALAVMLAIVTLTVWAMGPADLLRSTLSDGPWVQLNLVNWHLLAESASYWDRFGQERVFAHLWSIAVEEQFYLAWPVIVLLVTRSPRRSHLRVATAAVVISLLALVLMVTLADPIDPTRVYTGTDTRAFSLLLGAAAATDGVRSVLLRLPRPVRSGVPLVLMAGLGAAWAVVDGVVSPWLFTGGLFLHSLCCAALIAWCADHPGSRVSMVLSWWPLRRLGEVSYSLYLWHWPVIVLLSPEATGLHGWAWTAVVAAVSIALAAASTHLVENPVRFRAGWARGRRGLLAAVVTMAALAALWLALPGPATQIVDVTRLG